MSDLAAFFISAAIFFGLMTIGNSIEDAAETLAESTSALINATEEHADDHD